MTPPIPGPYSGTSTLALVARVSAFSAGLVYGSLKLKYLKITSSRWSFVSAILGQMTYLVADSTPDYARLCVM
nr:shikimate dehydrogenase [Tanacetum cinerariifolium]